MKNIVFCIFLAGLFSCASDDSTEPKPVDDIVSDCVVESDTISLASGESCNLSVTTADRYATTSGSVECNEGVLGYANSTFSSPGNGITFNGLTFICASS